MATRTSFSPTTVPWNTTRVVESFGLTLLAVHSTGMERGPVWVRMGSSVNMSSSTCVFRGHRVREWWFGGRDPAVPPRKHMYRDVFRIAIP